MNWMEACATSDGSDVVLYALRKPIKPQEKTRILLVETPTGGRARASKLETRKEISILSQRSNGIWAYLASSKAVLS